MATRFYLHSVEPADVTPTPDAAWENTGSYAARRMGPTKKTGDTLVTITGLTSTVGQDRLHRQYVSDPLPAGVVFDTAVTYKCYLQALESNADDNLRSRLGVRVVSKDGATVRHTVLSVADYSTATEWSVTPTLRGKAFANGDAGTGSYTTVVGDRLVIEIGHNDATGVSPSGQTRYGSGGTGADLGENETDTSGTANPWFETSATFQPQWEEGFEVSPDNTVITVANTSAASVAGAPVSDSGNVVDGIGAFSLMNAAAASTKITRFDFLNSTDWYLRFYFRMDTLPPANIAIASFFQPGGSVATGDLRVTTTGTLQLRNQALTLIDTSATVLAVGVWHRIEVHQTATRLEARIFAGVNHHGMTPDEDEVAFGGTIAITGSGVVNLGVINSTTWTNWIDEVAFSTVGWVGSATPSLEQDGFRGRNDDGTEITATWKVPENANWSQLVDQNFRVRFALSNDGGVTYPTSSPNAQLQYNRNGAGWNDVNGTSSVVRSVASSNITDNETTTGQLVAGSGARFAGNIDEANGVADISGATGLPAGSHAEVEYVVQVRSADVVDGDSIQLRVARVGGAALEVYRQTPTITVGPPGYADEVLADMPSLYWRLGEASGLPQDSSGSGRHADITVGDPTESQTGLLAGDSNTSMLYAVGDRHAISDDPALDIDANQDRTIEAWFASSNVGSGLNQSIVGKKQAFATAVGYIIYFNTSDQIVVRVGAATDRLVASGSAYLDGNPHHVVYVRDAINDIERLYVDGVQVASSTAGLPGDNLSNSQSFRVGAIDTTIPVGWVGRIDEVAVYPTALSATRVAAHWDAGKPTAGPVAKNASDSATATDSQELTGPVVQPHDLLNSSSDLSTYSGAVGAPAANRLIVAAIQASGATAGNTTISAITGYGLAWVPIAGPINLDVAGSIVQDAWLYAADTGSSPTSAAFSVTFAAARNGCHFSIFTVDGLDLSGGVAALFVQVVARLFADGAAATSGTITLATEADALNRAFLWSVNESSGYTTVGSGFTAIHGNAPGVFNTATPNAACLTAWRTDAFDTTVDANFATSTLWGGIAFELAFAPAGVQKVASDSGTAFDLVADRFSETTDAGTAVDASTSAAALDAAEAGLANDASILTAALARTDNGSGADASLLTAVLAVTDAASALDTSSLFTADLKVGSDAGTAADAISGAARTATDNGTGADTSALAAALARTDAAVGAELATITVPLAVTDTAVGADVSALTAALARTDAATAADAAILASALTASDAATGVDTAVLTMLEFAFQAAAFQDNPLAFQMEVTEAAIPKAASDSGTGSEVAAVTAIILATRTDAAVGVEASALAAVLAASDTATGADLAALTAPLAVADAAVGSEASAVVVAVTATDTAAGADASVLTAAMSRTDAGTAADVSLVTAALTVTDSISSAEMSSLSVPFSVTDAATGVDTSVLGTVLVAVTDLAVTSDTSQLDAGAFKNVSDTGTASDVSLLTAVLTATDSGTSAETAIKGLVVADTAVGSDLAATAAALTATDTASGADVSSLITANAKSANDSAVGVDTISAAAWAVSDGGTAVDASIKGLAVVDAASGADASAVVAAYQVTDSGSSAELSALTAVLIPTESATAVDTSSLQQGAAKTASDTATASDVVSTFAMVVAELATAADATSALSRVVTDSATGLDTSQLSAGALKTASDSATALDTSALEAGAAKVASDVGTAVDTALVTVAWDRSDSASGTEVSSYKAAIAVTDTAVGVQTAQTITFMQLAVQDSAHGVDVGVLRTGIGEALILYGRYDPVVVGSGRFDTTLVKVGRFAPELLGRGVYEPDVVRRGRFDPEAEFAGTQA